MFKLWSGGIEMTSARERITAKSIELLEAAGKAGMRFKIVVNKVHEAHPDLPINTVMGGVWDLDKRMPDRVVKPARGFYILKKYLEGPGSGVHVEAPDEEKPEEEDIEEEQFYEPFAEWLTRDLEEVSAAIPLGESYFGAKWGTPDVYGILEPKKTDIFKPPIEIVSAEIKINTKGLVTAFGQACAYKLFSHRSYLVVPSQSDEVDLSRLESLCEISGIGLVLFDKENPEDPEFAIRVRAVKHEPDWFYANETLRHEYIVGHLLS
jgi:hypothetical protein